MREFPWLSSVTRKESGFLCNGVLEFILKPIRGCTVTYYIIHPSQSSQKNVTRPLLLHHFSSVPALTQSHLTKNLHLIELQRVRVHRLKKVFDLTVLLRSEFSNSFFITPCSLVCSAVGRVTKADMLQHGAVFPPSASGLTDSLVISWPKNPTEASKWYM